MISENAKREIKTLLIDFVKSIIDRKTRGSGKFDIEKKKVDNPFGSLLIPMEIWKASSFERSYVTSFGNIGWEGISSILAADCGKYSLIKRNDSIHGTVLDTQLYEISTIINNLEHPKKKKGIKSTPNWNKEILHLMNIKTGIETPINVVSDLHLVSKDTGNSYFIEIKAPKPNADQTKVSKEKLLKLSLIKEYPNNSSFFALPYNPYGERTKYDHSHAKRYFDMLNSPAVLIGEEYWDKFFGHGTYYELLTIFEECGERTKKLVLDGFINRDSFKK